MSPRGTRTGSDEGREFHSHVDRIRMIHAMHRKDVQFKEGAGVAVAGVLGGVALALGGSWILLSQGAVLGAKVQTTLCILALALGGLVALVSAFFGLVIPHHVHREPGEWEKWCKGKC